MVVELNSIHYFLFKYTKRGIPAKSLYNLLKDLILSRTTVSSILERVFKAALGASIKFEWAGRDTQIVKVSVDADRKGAP